MIAFHLGSLGFLTQYNINTFAQDICGVLAGKKCTIIIMKEPCTPRWSIRPKNKKYLGIIQIFLGNLMHFYLF